MNGNRTHAGIQKNKGAVYQIPPKRKRKTKTKTTKKKKKKKKNGGGLKVGKSKESKESYEGGNGRENLQAPDLADCVSRAAE